MDSYISVRSTMDDRAVPDLSDVRLARVIRFTLADAIYRSCSRLTRRSAAAIVDEVFCEIIDGLRRDEKVVLSGFGTFRLKRKPLRIGRNPRTGDRHQIAARTIVTFRASKSLRQRLGRSGKANAPQVSRKQSKASSSGREHETSI